jgi:hypothetical protein
MLFIILAFYSGSAFPQSDFEGKIQVKLKGEDTNGNMNYMIKGEKIRLDFDMEESDQQMSMIIDPHSKKTLMIMPSQKMYMEYPYEGLSEETKEKMDESIGRVKMTGETKVINGHKCEKIIFTDEDGNSGEVWATKELGNFFNFFGNNPAESKNPQWLPKFMREGFFPMLGIQRNDSGEEEYRWEVTKIEEQSLSSDLFVPPAGFQKMDIPGMNFSK